MDYLGRIETLYTPEMDALRDAGHPVVDIESTGGGCTAIVVQTEGILIDYDLPYVMITEGGGGSLSYGDASDKSGTYLVGWYGPENDWNPEDDKYYRGADGIPALLTAVAEMLDRWEDDGSDPTGSSTLHWFGGEEDATS